jgi:NADH:ubiquinone oxidoreductase subunit D
MQSYEIYNKLDFGIPIGNSGDCYDRYRIRIEELRQSINIISQCLNNLPGGPVKNSGKISFPSRNQFKTNMESLIQHFIL